MLPNKISKLSTWCKYILCLLLSIIITIVYHPNINSSKSVANGSNLTEIRGVWLTNVASSVLFLPWAINRALYQLAQLNFNTVYPVVWNRGYTFYPSGVAKSISVRSQEPLLTIMRLGRDVLAEIVQQGHQQGLRVIPWFEYGFMAPASSQLARLHPDWLTESGKLGKIAIAKYPISNTTQQQVWLNPLHPEVQQLILDLIIEVVTKYDVDGIQLDDHFGMPVQLGYDFFTSQLYQQEHQGRKPPPNPFEPEWMLWRANKISKFMERIHKTVKSVKPNCLISLSPNSHKFAYKYYLQNWSTWIQRGWVDELVVQVYRDDLSSFISELIQPAVQMARRKIPVSIGITTGTGKRPVSITQIQQQVQAVRDRGFNGVSFFYWETLWSYITPESPQQRRRGFRELFLYRSIQ